MFTFSSDEKDAIGEIANMLVGAAACSISNCLDLDADISIPQVLVCENIDDVIGDNSCCYKIDNAGNTDEFHCLCLMDFGNYNEKIKCIDNNSQIDTDCEHLSDNVMKSVLDNLILLMGQQMNYNKLSKGDAYSLEKSDGNSENSNYEDSNYKDSYSEKADYGSIEFNIVLENGIEIQFKLLMVTMLAKEVANKFLNQGVAIL